MTGGPAARSSTRVLIIEDHALFAESLELALSLEGYDVRRVALAEHPASSTALLSTVARLHPRVVLLDLDLGRLGDGVRLIRPMARLGTNVVVVTASNDRARWGECVLNGARKTLSKTGPLSDIFATVRRISQGMPVMTREEREELLELWHTERRQHAAKRERLARLTRREQEVLAHLMAGRPVREIAKHSVVSEATVRTQVKSVLAKLEVSSQLAAVGIAHELGWQPAPAV